MEKNIFIKPNINLEMMSIQTIKHYATTYHNTINDVNVIDNI
jgi:NRPS condensation-like uncharacterized protein